MRISSFVKAERDWPNQDIGLGEIFSMMLIHMENGFFLYNIFMTFVKRIIQSFVRGPIYIIIFGMIFFGVGGGLTYRQMVNQQNNIQVQGEVIALTPNCDDDGCSYHSVVRYRTNEGIQLTYMSSFSSSPPAHEIGETVTVFYSPDNPEDAFIKGEGVVFRTVFMIVGGVIILFGFVFFSINIRNSFLSEED